MDLQKENARLEKLRWILDAIQHFQKKSDRHLKEVGFFDDIGMPKNAFKAMHNMQICNKAIERLISHYNSCKNNNNG